VGNVTVDSARRASVAHTFAPYAQSERQQAGNKRPSPRVERIRLKLWRIDG
jgi:hypothetical protein